MAKTYKLKNTKPEPVPEALMPMETFEAPPPPEKGRIIGLDCHPDIYAAAVYQGRSVHDARKLAVRDNMSLEAMLAWAGSEFTREDLFLLEASGNSFEIHARLLALGLNAVVLESSHVGHHAKKYADNDKMAAARIALVYLGTKAPCVWVPDAITSERRDLLHVYLDVVADHTAASNTIKGYLNKFAIRPGAGNLASPVLRKWIFEQRAWSPLQKEILDGYFANLDAQAQRRAGLERLICREISKEPLMLRCMKLLGIGRINAFALLATIGNVRRFARPEKLVAYLGLNPGQRESGNSKRVKVGIGKRGCSSMRHLLVQAAHAVLRAGAKTPLGKWGWMIFGRKGNRNIAVAAIARKLAVQVWHLLMGNPPKAVEGDKTLTLKLQRLASCLGGELRAELGLPAKLAHCVSALKDRITGPPVTTSPA